MKSESDLKALWYALERGESDMCKIYNTVFLMGYKMALEDILEIKRHRGAPQ